VPTIATVPCGDMVARYDQDEVTGVVRLSLLPASSAPSDPRRQSVPGGQEDTEAPAGLGPPGGRSLAVGSPRGQEDTPSPAGLGSPGGQEDTEAGAEPEPGFAHESLVQLFVVGDTAGGERTQGRTLRNSSTTKELRLVGHRVAEGEGAVEVTVDVVAEGKLMASHSLRWRPGAEAVEVDVSVTNISDTPITLQLLTSFCLAGIGPPSKDDAPGRFLVHRLRSGWSSEARLVSEPFEDLHLEGAWSDHAVNADRFGQVGTMPVRGFAPCAGIEDTAAGLTWGAQLAWAGSWQMELFGRGGKVSLSGGLADFDFGHWRKTLAPGESFSTPRAWLTVVRGDFDECAQRLVGMQERAGVDAGAGTARLEELEPAANEWCTTWGRPRHELVVAMADRLAGSGVKYLVIDAGWYESASGRWIDAHGDWVVDRTAFPEGLAATAKAVRERGLVPGLWVELETCGSASSAFSLTDHLLKRDGVPVTAGVRRFWDFRDPFVTKYLSERVVRLLEDCEMGYLKIDYNETLGAGCDGAGSAGEGLRLQVAAAHEFLVGLRGRMPHLVIENCASGGHRLEPSLMALSDLGSFSDAFECPELPVIAANVNRLLPGKRSLVWVVLHRSDSREEQIYKLSSGLLGRPCLSGELTELDDEQWRLVNKALALYEKAAPAFANGHWRRFGPRVSRYRAPTGWQALLRTAQDGQGALAVFHAFAAPPAEPVRLDLPGPESGPGSWPGSWPSSWPSSWMVESAIGNSQPQVEDGAVLWEAPGPFTAAAAWLRPAG
jgi:alpha-galactosidase